MQVEKRTFVKVRLSNKINTVSIGEDSIKFGQDDDEIVIQFDNKVNLQNLLNLMLLSLHQKFVKTNDDTDWQRSSYTYDYEVLNNADMIANLRTMVRDANNITLSD